MKHIISDRDVDVGFLRCSCDTKYNRSAFDLLAVNGCRVCGHEFLRLTDTDVLVRLHELSDSLSPEMLAFLVRLVNQK